MTSLGAGLAPVDEVARTSLEASFGLIAETSNADHFAGIRVRHVMINGEPWFVLADVVEALGLARSASAVVDRLDGGVRQTYPIRDRLGREQRATVVSEPGVYEVVIRSDAPSARPFRHWLTHEVLPSIRRTGVYAVPETREQLLARAVIEATTAIAEKDQHIAALTPRAEAWDELASAEGDYSVADAAKILARAGIDTGPQRLFRELAGIRWIFRGGEGKWRAYADKVDAGYLAERPQSHHHPETGAVVVDPPQVRITLRGVERLRVRLGAITAEVAL